MKFFRSVQKNWKVSTLLLFFIYGLHSTENHNFGEIKRLIFNKKYDRALYLIYRAEEKAPNHFELYLLRADILEKQNKPEEAVIEYKKSIYLNKKQPKVFAKIASIYRKLNKPVEEFDFIRLFLATEKNNKEARYRSIVLSSRLGLAEYFTYSSNLIPKEEPDSIEKNIKEIQSLQKKKTV